MQLLLYFSVLARYIKGPQSSNAKYIQIVKGTVSPKSWGMWGVGVLVWAIIKHRYGFLNFSDLPFTSCDFSKFKLYLIKPVLILKDLAALEIQNWNPPRSAVPVYTVEGSVLESRNPCRVPILNTLCYSPDSKLEFRRTLLLAGLQIGIIERSFITPFSNEKKCSLFLVLGLNYCSIGRSWPPSCHTVPLNAPLTS
jgi:hypothetical protein